MTGNDKALSSLLIGFFEKEGIGSYGAIPFSDCTVINERALKRYFADVIPKTVVMFAVPYYTKCEKKNISVYAFSKDYHVYFRQLSARLGEYLSENGCDEKYFICGDNSPIDERNAAVKCLNGFVGRNGMLTDPVFGSWFFLGGIYLFSETVLPGKDPGKEKSISPVQCLDCGKCVEACPTGALTLHDYTKCLSYITQKKRLDEGEEEIIRKNKSVWGCDACQEACPYNEGANETGIRFFKENRVTFIDKNNVGSIVNGDDFPERAFSWHGKEVIERNVGLIFGPDGDNN